MGLIIFTVKLSRSITDTDITIKLIPILISFMNEYIRKLSKNAYVYAISLRFCIIYTVNKKGKVLQTAKLQARKGKIHTIVNRNKYSIYAYSSSGSTSFSHATTDFRKGNFSTASANYSYDGDGTFHKKKGAGDYNVIQYDARTPTKAVATCAIEFGTKVKNYEQVFAYAVIDEQYENMIEEGTAETSLKVFDSKKKIIRELEFKAPVKQVMSCRHHEGDAETDKLYILLWNGNLYSVTGAMIMHPEVGDEKLDLKLAVVD